MVEVDAETTIRTARWWCDRLSLMGKSAVVEMVPGDAEKLDTTINSLLTLIANQSREIAKLQGNLSVAIARATDAQRATASAHSMTNMYASAWAREIGREGFVPKAHEIDSLVLTTRQVMDERAAVLPAGYKIEFQPKARDSSEPASWRVTTTGFIATEYSYANAVRRAWTHALIDSKEPRRE